MHDLIKSKKLKIGVYGSWRDGSIAKETLQWAYGLGQAIGDYGHILVTGGSGGVSLESRRGCKDAEGINLGIIPEGRQLLQVEKRSYIDIAFPTGFGALGRMPLIANTVDFAFAIGGGAGTVAEILLTYLQQKPVMVVVGLHRPNDPIMTNLLTRTKEIEIDKMRIRYGWIDSKTEDMVAPIYLLGKNLGPKRALDIGLNIFATFHSKWDKLPMEGPLNE